jgi:hypothetical protein
MVTLKIFLASAFTAILIANGSSNVAVTSDDLINNAKDYDKKEVVYSGEVIGDIMKRGENTWINVSDGTNAIGIWIATEEAKEVKYEGKYSFTGDTVKVTGMFNRACPEHGGDLDIHASKLDVEKQGHVDIKKINYKFILISVILLVVALLLNIFILKKKL